MTKRLHKDGTLLDVSVTVSPVRNAAGEVVGASKIARDAGPYLRDQERIRKSEEHLRMLADNISQFAWIARPDGHIFWYNRRWYEYTGTTLEEMEGWGWRKVQHPDHLERVEAHFRESIAKSAEWEDTFPLRGARRQVALVPVARRADPRRRRQHHLLVRHQHRHHRAARAGRADPPAADRSEPSFEEHAVDDPGAGPAQRPQRRRFHRRFEDRVRSLGGQPGHPRAPRSGARCRSTNWSGCNSRSSTTRSTISKSRGPDCSINPRAAEVIGMALHELATNSLKYGSLSAEGGKVTIGWDKGDGDEGFRLWWRESGGPPVEEPTGSGFGTTLIRDVPRHTLGAEVDIDLPARGGVLEARRRFIGPWPALAGPRA